MGFEKELNFIKGLQRNYFEKFGKKLVIDFAAMKDTLPARCSRDLVEEKDVEKFYDRCLKKYNADKEVIDSKVKLFCPKYGRESKALTAFSKRVITSGWNVSYAARLVGRNHAVIYYYAKNKLNDE